MQVDVTSKKDVPDEDIRKVIEAIQGVMGIRIFKSESGNYTAQAPVTQVID